MPPFNQLLALFMSVSTGILMLLLFYEILVIKVFQYVDWHSKRVYAMNIIQKDILFHDISPKYALKDSLKSKNQYDTYNDAVKFNDLLKQHRHVVETSLSKAQDNRQTWSMYSEKLQHLPGYLTVDDSKKARIPYRMMCHIEEQMCYRLTYEAPVQTFGITVNISYTSPKGRSHYSRLKAYSELDIIKHLQQLDDQEDFKKTAAYQRKLLTAGLRYDILKRDHFKCVLCGRTADEGFKMHVDHTYPVSKGGKTVKNNLRTLCQDCNLGKSAKYDANGPN